MVTKRLLIPIAMLPLGLLALCAGCGDDTAGSTQWTDSLDAAAGAEKTGSGWPGIDARANGGEAGTRTSTPSSATIIVLPDTQYYVYSSDSGFYTAPDHAGVFGEQTAWILAHKNDLAINAVLHVGDLVDSPDDADQWKVAGAAMHAMDGIIPYVVVPGNHDTDSKRKGLENGYFSPSTMPWITGTKLTGQMDNNYALVDIGGREWLVVALEFGPTNDTVAWANKVLAAFSDHPAILITHAYLYADGTRYNVTAAGTDSTQGSYQWWYPQYYGFTPSAGINDGEMLWKKLVLPNSNVRLVFSGHVTGLTGAARLTSTRPDGTLVHQMLSDYQWLNHDDYGYGFLRIVRLDFANKTIQVQTYSPDLNEYLTDDSNQFTLDMNF